MDRILVSHSLFGMRLCFYRHVRTGTALTDTCWPNSYWTESFLTAQILNSKLLRNCEITTFVYLGREENPLPRRRSWKSSQQVLCSSVWVYMYMFAWDWDDALKKAKKMCNTTAPLETKRFSAACICLVFCYFRFLNNSWDWQRKRWIDLFSRWTVGLGTYCITVWAHSWYPLVEAYWKLAKREDK